MSAKQGIYMVVKCIVYMHITSELKAYWLTCSFSFFWGEFSTSFLMLVSVMVIAFCCQVPVWMPISTTGLKWYVWYFFLSSRWIMNLKGILSLLMEFLISFCILLNNLIYVWRFSCCTLILLLFTKTSSVLLMMFPVYLVITNIYMEYSEELVLGLNAPYLPLGGKDMWVTLSAQFRRTSTHPLQPFKFSRSSHEKQNWSPW